MTVATSIALTLALVLPVLKVLTLALDSSCRSFFFLYNNFASKETTVAIKLILGCSLKQNEIKG